MQLEALLLGILELQIGRAPDHLEELDELDLFVLEHLGVLVRNGHLAERIRHHGLALAQIHVRLRREDVDALLHLQSLMHLLVQAALVDLLKVVEIVGQHIVDLIRVQLLAPPFGELVYSGHRLNMVFNQVLECG